MITCPFCATENVNGDTKCKKCFQPLPKIQNCPNETEGYIDPEKCKKCESKWGLGWGKAAMITLGIFILVLLILAIIRMLLGDDFF